VLGACLSLAVVGHAWAQVPGQVPQPPAQVPIVRRVEFEEAVRLALERSPAMATATVSVAEAGSRSEQTKALTLPSAFATMNNVTLDGKRGFSGGVTQPQNQFLVGASVGASLVDLPLRSEVSQARDQVDVVTQTAAETRRQVASAAAGAYLNVIAARHQVEVDERALETARAHLDYADKRLEGGVGSRLNQLRAAQVASDGETQLENSRLLLRRTQETLGVLLVENGPVDAGAAPVFEHPTTIVESEWAMARPDLRAQLASVRAAERVVEDSWKVWFPTAAVSFEPQVVTPTSLFQPSRTWRVVFSVSQRVFEYGHSAETAVKRAALDRAQFARTSVEIQARSEVRIAQDAVRSRERAVTSARLAADQANEVLRISTAAFEVGATTNLEVIDAQRSARDAETSAALAEDLLQRARLDLLVAIGRFPQ